MKILLKNFVLKNYTKKENRFIDFWKTPKSDDILFIKLIVIRANMWNYSFFRVGNIS